MVACDYENRVHVVSLQTSTVLANMSGLVNVGASDSQNTNDAAFVREIP
jgi:hypothetical protein